MGALLLLAGALAATQPGLTLLGLTEESAAAAAQKVITQQLGQTDPTRYGRIYEALPVRKAFLALSPEQRTTAAQALAPFVKALILSPAFRAAWETEVKKRGGADHGLKPQSPNEMAMKSEGQVIDESKKMMLKSRIQDAQQFSKFKQMPADSLKMMIDIDESMVAPADSMFVASPAARKAALAKYAEARKFLPGNPEAAQKALLDAKLLSAGLAAGSGGVDQAMSKVSDDNANDEKRRQQETWNKLLMTPLLKKELEQFVQTAATVDFAAATQPKEKKIVFVNPEYEKRKSLLWKLLFRAGKGPTTAVAAAAKQLLAELK